MKYKVIFDNTERYSIGLTLIVGVGAITVDPEIRFLNNQRLGLQKNNFPNSVDAMLFEGDKIKGRQ